MASSSCLSFLVLLFVIGVNARPGVHFHPCKILFISSSSSYTTTISSSGSFNLQNPNNRFPLNSKQQQQIPTHPSFTIFDFYPIQEQEQLLPLEIVINRRSDYLLLPQTHSSSSSSSSSFGGVAVTSSRGQRSKDILSVVAALLFGVACGALTSATMYLAWSLITNTYYIPVNEEEEEDTPNTYYIPVNEEEEEDTPNKMGYSGDYAPKEVV